MKRNPVRRRIRRALRRVVRGASLALLILSVVSASLPASLLPAWLPTAAPKIADAETLSSPRFVSAALMPSGQVGLVFENVTGSSGEIRFVRYTDEHALGTSTQLSTAAPSYPQLAVLGTTLVAAYVDTRSPNAGKLILRTSTDNGANWSAEANPFGSETFDSGGFAPRLVASHAGTALYLFTAANGARPQYRSTTDLSTWTTAAAAGDTSMRVTSANNCGSAGQECYRAHAFSFMETATAGSWVYVTKSDSGWGQSGRGTQVGTLGGSWSTQVDHGGSGGLSGGGDSTATTFLDRSGNVYFIRATEFGNNLYFRKSTDGGATWGSFSSAYGPTLASYTTAAPVGLYVPGYAFGEYLWYAGFGGGEDTLRVTPIWSAAQTYARSGTVRLLGSAGSDLDLASAFAYNHGDPAAEFGAGGFSTAQTDLSLPGRLLPFSFSRAYSSGDEGRAGYLGPGWTHSFDWSVSENAGLVTIKRGDGARDRFTRNTDGSYAAAPGVFDTLTKNTDGSFTLTTPGQTKYELGVPVRYSPVVTNATPTAYWRLGEQSGTTASDATSNHLNGTYSGTYTLAQDGAIGADPDSAVAFGGGSADMGSPTALNISGSALSVEFWAKGQPGSYNYLVSHTDGGSQGYAIYTGGDATYHFYIGRAGGLHISGGVGGTWDGAWHHFVNVYDGSALRIYVDGVARLTEAETSSLTGYTGNFRLAGYNGGGYNFGGTLDEVAVYSRALSASEASDHYQAGISPSGVLTRIHEPAGNALTLGYVGARLSTVTDTVGRQMRLDYGLGGTNLAQGKTYTKSSAASSSYPDSGGTELTDGVVGDDGSFSVAAWSGYQLSSPLDVTIDLGATTSLGGFRSYFFHAPASGVYRPASVEILGSTDGSTFTSLGSTASTAAPQDSRYRYMYDLVATGSARYVRFLINSGGTWTFASEMQIFAAGEMPLTAGADIVDGISYTKSATPSGSYPDSGNAELTDGNLGEPSTWNDWTWQGHANLGTTPLDVTFDLGTTTAVGLVRSWYSKSESDGIYLPATVEVQTSPDSTTWTSRGSTTASAAVNDAGRRWRYEVDANGGSGRYLRLRITSGGTWLFVGEIQVFANGAPPVDRSLAGDRIFALSDPSGRRTAYAYDTFGRLNGVTDRLGNSGGQDPTAHTWRYGYDGTSRHLTTIKDPDGRVLVTNTYDSLGRLTTQKDGLNKTTSFAYSGSTVTLTDPRLHDSVQSYDARKRLISVQDVVGAATYTASFTYDDCGDRSSSTDRNGNRSDYTYDTACKGNLLTLQEPQLDPSTPRFTTTWSYDAKNNPTLRTDAKGFTTGWTYDSTSNVRLSETRQIDASTSATTKWIYGDTANPGLPTRVVAPRGNTTGTPDNTYSTVLAYDSAGNLTSSTDADGDQTTYAYDSLGRRTSMVDPDGNVSGGTPSQHTWSTAYDPLDRVTSETDPLSHATVYTYDNAGHRVGLTDKNSNLTTYVYDAAGQLSNVQQQPDPLGQPTLVYTTSITRDDNGNATSVTQANGVVTDYSYDDLNRLVSMTTHPATGTTLTTSFTLDGEGNVTTRTTADSVATNYTFDNDGRLTQIAATGLSTISYAYDELSRRSSMTDVSGTTTYSYDRMGRLTQAAQPNGTTAYAYDLDSNRTTLTYPGSSSVTYTFSNAGRLSSLSDWASRSTSYTYTAAGLTATVTLPNTMVTTYTYDRAQRLTNLTNVISSNAITSHAYTLDSAGNRTALSEFVSGITTGSSDSFGFTYDGLERLTAVTTTNAESFTLDAASNITARTGPSKTFTIDASNRPTSDGTNTLTWSSADRLTGRGSDSFGFDPLDRLTSSTVSSTSRTYAYNGDGLLQSRTTGGTTVSLLWDPATSPSRLLVSGSDKIVYGLGPLYTVNGSTVTTYARDGQKSIRAELNGSTVTSSWRYRAYGEIAQNSGASTPSLLGYAGQMLDPSALYYMRARWYDPANSRFVSRDPLTGDSVSPSTLNEFGYAAGDPIDATDPTGLEPLLDVGSSACGHSCFASWKDGNVGCFDIQICHTDTLPATSPRFLPRPLVGPNANTLLIASDAEDGDSAVASPASPSPGGSGPRDRGNRFRDAVRAALEAMGYTVRTEVGKRTAIGWRFVDLEVSKDGEVLGGIETKWGSGRYRPEQEFKDMLLALDGYHVVVIRGK